MEGCVRLFPVVRRVPVHHSHKNGPVSDCWVPAAGRVIFRRVLVCRRGAWCSLWFVTPYRHFVTLRWQNLIRARRGMCQADTVLGGVCSGNWQASGGIITVRIVLQPVFKQFRSRDPVLRTRPQHGGGRCCSWRRIRKSNVKFRKTTVTNEYWDWTSVFWLSHIFQNTVMIEAMGKV